MFSFTAPGTASGMKPPNQLREPARRKRKRNLPREKRRESNHAYDRPTTQAVSPSLKAPPNDNRRGSFPVLWNSGDGANAESQFPRCCKRLEAGRRGDG